MGSDPMGVYWVPQAVVGIFVWPLAWIIAAVVLFTRPDRAQNRWLALVIALEGVMMGTGGGWVHASQHLRAAWALQMLTVLAAAALAPAYLLFISTLKGRISDFLSRRLVQRTLQVWLVGTPILVLWLQDMYISAAARDAWPVIVRGPGFTIYGGTGFQLGAVVIMLASVLGLLASVGMWRRAATGVERRQAGAFMRAFAWRDIGYIMIFSLVLTTPDTHVLYTGVLAPSLLILVFIPLLAYAILKHQILGIDLTIKRNVRRGLFIAPFAVAFFVATETLEGLLPFQSYWIGLAAAGALALAVAPLQGMSRRAADRLMPGVEDTEAYRDQRAQEIYDAAWMAAQRDGRITSRERLILDRLAQELGLAPGGHQAGPGKVA